MQVQLQLANLEREDWQSFVSGSRHGHLMQSWEWGEYKESLGWKAERIGVFRDHQLVAGAQLLLKSLPILPYSVAYLPKGPVVDPADQEAASTILAAVHRSARQRRAVFVKIEPNWLDDQLLHSFLKELGFRPSASTNQPRCTIVVDLAKSEDALLAGMRKKTRQYIRRAQREGITTEEGHEADLDEFYRIMVQTAQIKTIEVHEPAFYRQAWRTFQPSGSARLFQAKHEGQTVAAKMVFTFGEIAMHLWGGATPHGRDLCATYLLRWEAIRWAKAHGLERSNLWGIPDEIAEMIRLGQSPPADRDDGLWGVYKAKRGFGGVIESYVGAYDYAYSPVLYRLAQAIQGRNQTSDAASVWLERLSHIRLPKHFRNSD